MNFYMSNSNLIPQYSFPPSQIPHLYLSSATEANCLALNNKVNIGSVSHSQHVCTK